jgi:SagB-type dehydrogenase family enzyme
MRKKVSDTDLLERGEASIWETFHENSKTSRYDQFLTDMQVETLASFIIESFSYDQYPEISLPDSLTPLQLSLAEALQQRETARELEASSISLEQLATILHYSYGVNRSSEQSGFRRPLRMVASAGALYPLEFFFHTSHVEGLRAGLYHYNPMQHDLRFISVDDNTSEIAAALVQKTIAVQASLMIFITAKLEGITTKYGDRGYRYALLEAGHAAQNVNLVANALSLGCINIGGYFDRQVDALLNLDGLTHSTLYLIAVGGRRRPR